MAGNYKINIVYIRSIFVMLLIFMFTSVSAQTDTTEVVMPVTSTVQSQQFSDFRVPDKDKIKEYQNDNRFKYERVEKSASWWDKAKYRFFEMINDMLSAVSRSGMPGIAVIIVIVLVICLILLKFLGVDYRKVLGKKEIDTPEIDIYTENVHEMDFDTLISNAMKNKDFRLVVRFLYLKNLKFLSDKEMIDWKANKTNYSYQYEISNPSVRSKFLETSLIFDYIWYGEFPLDEARFSEIYTRMEDFNKMIGNER